MSDGTSKKSEHSCESAWMARWTYTSCETATQNHSHLLLNENNGGTKKRLLVGGPEMAASDSILAKRSGDVSESRRVDIVVENMKGSSEKPGSDKPNIQLFPMLNIFQQRDSYMACPKVEPSRECSLKLGGDLFREDVQQRSHKFLEKTTLPFLSSFQDVIGSSSKIQPSGFISKRHRVQSLMNGQEENVVPTPSSEYEKKLSARSYSKFPFYERRTENPLDPTRPMRISTTADSVQEIARGPSRFCQTTHRFLIAKKADVNLSEDGQLFRESTVSMKLKGKMFGEFLNPFPDLGFRHQPVLKLQPVGSSMDSEGRENSDEVKGSAICIKNESSAEADILDIDNSLRNQLPDMTSSPSDKAGKGQQDRAKSQIRTEIPEVNLELPVVPDRENSTDNERETSTWKTQSMNEEHFFTNTKLHKNSNRIESEPGNRWIKRLKTSASGYFTGHGTESLTVEDALTGEKLNNFSTKIMKCRIASSEPTISGKTLTKNSRSENITLLHPWIQRWCRNKAMSEKGAQEEFVFEAVSSKGTTALADFPEETAVSKCCGHGFGGKGFKRV